MKEIKIENVPTLSNLLASSKSKYKSFYDFIDNKGPISVLDLGCGFPWHLIFIYHNFKYKRLLGLDIQPRHSYHIGNQKSQIKSVLPELTVDEFNTLDTFFKVYDKFFDCDHRYHKKIKDEIEWKKIFDIKTRTIDKFLDENTAKFDIIIASNVLHFPTFSNLRNTIFKIKSSLNVDGLALILVQEKIQDDFVFDYKLFLVYLEEIFGEGEIYPQLKDGKWWNTLFINKEGLI